MSPFIINEPIGHMLRRKDTWNARDFCQNESVVINVIVDNRWVIFRLLPIFYPYFTVCSSFSRLFLICCGFFCYFEFLQLIGNFSFSWKIVLSRKIFISFRIISIFWTFFLLSQCFLPRSFLVLFRCFSIFCCCWKLVFFLAFSVFYIFSALWEICFL